MGTIDQSYRDRFSKNGEAMPLTEAMLQVNQSASLSSFYMVAPEHNPVARKISTTNEMFGKNQVLLDEVHIKNSTAR